MLSERMLDILNAGEFDLAIANGSKGDWNADEQKFENMRGWTLSCNEEAAADLEDRHIRLFKEIPLGE